jgi:hypothetical protein
MRVMRSASRWTETFGVHGSVVAGALLASGATATTEAAAAEFAGAAAAGVETIGAKLGEIAERGAAFAAGTNGTKEELMVSRIWPGFRNSHGASG